MLPGLSNHSSMDVKPETIELFQRDGFVAVSAFYDSGELASIEAELDRFKRECIPELESTEVYYEEIGDASSLKQIQRMQQHDDCFAGLMDDKPRRLAEQLLGEEVVPKISSTSTSRRRWGRPRRRIRTATTSCSSRAAR